MSEGPVKGHVFEVTPLSLMGVLCRSMGGHLTHMRSALSWAVESGSELLASQSWILTTTQPQVPTPLTGLPEKLRGP